MGEVFSFSDSQPWRMTRHCPVAVQSGCEFRARKCGGADLFYIHWKWKANGNMENWSFFVRGNYF